MPSLIKCFGFFNASRTCENCPLQKDCKFVLVAVGFDVVRAVQSEMMVGLPEGAYVDTDRMSVLVEQISGIRVPEPDDTLQAFDTMLDEDQEIDLAKVV